MKIAYLPIITQDCNQYVPRTLNNCGTLAQAHGVILDEIRKGGSYDHYTLIPFKSAHEKCVSVLHSKRISELGTKWSAIRCEMEGADGADIYSIIAATLPD